MRENWAHKYEVHLLMGLIVVSLVIACMAFETVPDILYKVKCDSGFETPTSTRAYMSDGAIVWKEQDWQPHSYRKMLPGETCHSISIESAE